MFATKTVIGIYPVSAFVQSNVAIKEVDDSGDVAGKNVEIWQAPGSDIAFVLYRNMNTTGGNSRIADLELSLVVVSG